MWIHRWGQVKGQQRVLFAESDRRRIEGHVPFGVVGENDDL